jgi:hypothetical protein
LVPWLTLLGFLRLLYQTHYHCDHCDHCDHRDHFDHRDHHGHHGHHGHQEFSTAKNREK